MRLLLDTHVFLWYVTADAQALEHGLTIASLDPVVRAYPAPCL